MKSFNLDFLKNVYKPALGYYVKEFGLVDGFKKTIEYIYKIKNRSGLYEYLKNLGVKTCVKDSAKDLYFKSLEREDLSLDKDYVLFEIGLVAFLAIILKKYDCTVGITRARHDGGFDVAVRSNASNDTLLIDAKSGSNTSDKHVEWEYFADPHSTWLYKVVRKAPSTKWNIANSEKENKKVFDLSLDKFIENMVKAVMLDINDIAETLDFASLCYCQMNAVKNYN